MPSLRSTLGLACVLVAVLAVAAPEAQRGRRASIQVMTLSIPAWTDGAEIPAAHSQVGDEVSPALSWSSAPEGTLSFALIVHDLDAASGNGLDDRLHWMLWNIPPTAGGLPEGVGQGPELADGTRQISVSGPYYRGPARPPATDPAHHYLFEFYALDAMIDVPAVGESPAATRAAVIAAMAGHIRGKATYVGRF